MSRKVALVAFNGDPMCFVHVLLNALDMDSRGYEVRVVVEGSATKLMPNLKKPDAPFFALYTKVFEKGLIHTVCKACSAKMGVLSEVEELNLPLGAEMSGHPSLAAYREEGFEVMTF